MSLLAQGTQWIQTESLFEENGIPLAIMGIAVVFAALVLISVCITLLPLLMAALHHYHPEPSTERAPAKPTVAKQDELPEDIQVVIAAAVAHCISQPHRIIHTQELTSDQLGWSLEGRMQLHTSHRIRQQDRR